MPNIFIGDQNSGRGDKMAEGRRCSERQNGASALLPSHFMVFIS